MRRAKIDRAVIFARDLLQHFRGHHAAQFFGGAKIFDDVDIGGRIGARVETVGATTIGPFIVGNLMRQWNMHKDEFGATCFDFARERRDMRQRALVELR